MRARNVREHQIQQDQLWRGLLRDTQPINSSGGCLYLVPSFGEIEFQHITQVGFVFDDYQIGHSVFSILELVAQSQ
jgi:hypothetical protein